MHTRTLAAAVAAASALLLTGCSSISAAGDPVADTAENDTAFPIAPGEMDPGPYPTTPQADFGAVANESEGTAVEGQRMAEYVVLPTELDPELTESVPMSTYVIKDGPSLANLMPGREPQIADTEGMIVGFSTSRSHPDRAVDRSIVHAVLRFPNAAAASRAAEQMSAAGTEPVDGVTPAVPSRIDILPETAVTTRTTGESFSSEGFTARGDYVIYTWAGAPAADTDWVAQMIAAAVDQQGPMIDQFPATPAADIAALPMDIDNVLVLTLPAPEGRWASDLAVYGARGAAHFATDPSVNAEMMNSAGADRMATDDTNVYRAEDDAGAAELHTLFADEAVRDQGLIPAASPPGVPGASCFLYETAQGDYTYCLVHRGRYLGEVSGLDDEKGVHQKATAQYMILDSVA